MAEQNGQPSSAQAGGGYGFTTDEVKVNPFNFGLNAGNCFLIKFEWIPNGGKDGAEQEALDIVFTINGTEKSYRKFPVTKAFDKNQNEITDPNAPEMKEAMSDFNAVITHILHCYVDIESIKAVMAVPITSFKQFCQIAMSILPKTYKEIPLDIFLQWGWQISTNGDKTYLEIPNKMKYGRFLAPAQAPINGSNWEEKRVENPTNSTREALWYEDSAGNKHPFTKNGWFMRSSFASQQRTYDSASSSSSANTSTSTSQTVPPPADTKKAATW